MKVDAEKELYKGHKIQCGKATWDNKTLSIRSAYYLENNKFNLAGSSEVSSNDLVEMVVFAMENGFIKNKELRRISKVIDETLILKEEENC